MDETGSRQIPAPISPPPGEDLLPLQPTSEPPNQSAGDRAPSSETAGSGPGPRKCPPEAGQAVGPLSPLAEVGQEGTEKEPEVTVAPFLSP